MITVVTWKWRCPGYRTEFHARHVNSLRRQFEQHLSMPHRFVCVTDDPAGVDCDTIPLWPSPLKTPINPKKPNCYVRLWAFAKEAERLFGRRFVSIDLDAVVTGSLDPLLDRPEDFVIWGYTHPTTPYNGSMFLQTAGARTKVWEQFDPDRTPDEARRNRYAGSDQAVISMILGPGEAMWGTEDGVYGYRNHLTQTPDLPENARLVFFHGKRKPWEEDTRRRAPWIREHATY